MNGIFNYHVPGVSSQKSNSDTGRNSSLRKDAANKFQNIMPWCRGHNSSSLLKALYLLLAHLISQLDGGHCADKPSCDERNKPPGGGATTLALGEEDGGTKPPDITTKAMGEEDGCIKPPDVTTMALGEEDGGIKPPINKPPIYTTMAIW